MDVCGGWLFCSGVCVCSGFFVCVGVVCMEVCGCCCCFEVCGLFFLISPVLQSRGKCLPREVWFCPLWECFKFPSSLE